MKRRLLQCFLIACLYAHTALGEAELLTIDDAVAESMKYLSGKLAPESKTVILNIESESKKLSNYIIDESSVFIMNSTNLPLIDKSKISAVLKKKNINDLSEINDQAAEIGKELGAESVIFGSISKAGKNYRLRIQAVNAEDGKVLGMQSLNVIEDEILADLAGQSPSAQTQSASINSQNASNQNPNVQVVVVRDTPAQADATAAKSELSDEKEKTSRTFLGTRWQWAIYKGGEIGQGFEFEIGKYRDLILSTTIWNLNFLSGGSGNINENIYTEDTYPKPSNEYDGGGSGGGGGGYFRGAIISAGDNFRVIPGMDVGFWMYRYNHNTHFLFGGPDVRVMLGYQFVFFDVSAKLHLGLLKNDNSWSRGQNEFVPRFSWGAGITFLLGGN